MSKQTDKEVFTALGVISGPPNRHELVFNSEPYVADQLNRLPVGKKVSMTIYESRPVRSESQLAYHFVLIDYIAKHTGYTKTEMHDIIMKDAFGTKIIEFRGKRYQARESMSETGNLSVSQVVELITKDLEVCKELEIAVPTAAELGYTPSNVDYKDKI